MAHIGPGDLKAINLSRSKVLFWGARCGRSDNSSEWYFLGRSPKSHDRSGSLRRRCLANNIDVYVAEEKTTSEGRNARETSCTRSRCSHP